MPRTPVLDRLLGDHVGRGGRGGAPRRTAAALARRVRCDRPPSWSSARSRRSGRRSRAIFCACVRKRPRERAACARDCWSPRRGPGSGKTTVTLGLQRALRRRGLRVRGRQERTRLYRPRLSRGGHRRDRASTSTASPWTIALLHALAAAHAPAARTSSSPRGRWASSTASRARPGRTGASADIAARFGWPVLLVLDVSGQAQSAAAIALGCAAIRSAHHHHGRRSQPGGERPSSPAGRGWHQPDRASGSGRAAP